MVMVDGKQRGGRRGLAVAKVTLSLLRVSLLLLTTTLGRLLILATAIGLATLYTPVIWPQYIVWGWSFLLIPVGLGLILGTLVVAPRVVARQLYWRLSLSVMLGIASLSTALALVAWNSGQILGTPISANLGELLAFWPAAFNRGNIDVFLWILGGLRAGALLVAALVAVRPRLAWTVPRFVWISAVVTAVVLWGPFGRLLRWRKERNLEAQYKGMRESARSTAQFHSTLADRADKFPWRLPIAADVLEAAVPFALMRGEAEDRKAKIEKIFAATGQEVRVVNVAPGALISYYFVERVKADPSGFRKAHLSDDLKRAVKNESPPMLLHVRGDVVAGVEVTNEHAGTVALRHVIDDVKFRDFAEQAAIPLAIGLDRTQAPVTSDLTELHNLLINGENDTERSQCLRTILLSILLLRKPNDVRVVLWGTRDGALTQLPRVPYLYGSPVVNGNDCILSIEQLSKVMGERLDASEEGATQARPDIVLVIEDLDVLLPLLPPDSTEKLARLLKWGERAGIHVVASCNLAYESDVAATLRNQFDSRICFKSATAEISLSLLGNAAAFHLSGRGDTLFWSASSAKLSKVQCADPSPGEIGNVIGFWTDVFAPTMPQLPEVDIDLPGTTVEFLRKGAAAGLGAANSASPAHKVVTSQRPLLNSYDATRLTARGREAARPGFSNQAASDSHAITGPPDAAAELGHGRPERFHSNGAMPEHEGVARSSLPGGYQTAGHQRGGVPRASQIYTGQASGTAWQLPSMQLIEPATELGVSKELTDRVSTAIVDCMAQHGVEVTVEQVLTGPTVTMYGLHPGWKNGGKERVRVDHILKLEKDLALSLGTKSIRFENAVAGPSAIGSGSFIGIEVPNDTIAKISLRSIMDTAQWREFESKAAIPVPLAVGNGCAPVFTDLAKAPHLLVAGATGSGKSVCINTLVNGVLLTRTPEQVRLVLIDPKRVELTQYGDIPHLYAPVVVEPKHALLVLASMVDEMEKRLRMLQGAGVRDIAAYNQRMQEPLPYLLMVVDELADLMLTSKAEVERLLTRLAQLGRAAGIHVVVATQRPSVDVVGGLIKANFPCRVSFALTSQVDSKTILDRAGGEKLLGRGDMLFMPSDSNNPRRMQCAFISDREIDSIVQHWQIQPHADLEQLDVDLSEQEDEDVETLSDAALKRKAAATDMVEQAVALAGTQKTLSISSLQRKLGLGYPRAARLMDELEELGIVGPGEAGNRARQVLIHSSV